MNKNTNECIFCKIVNKELDAYIIDENEYAIAFLDAFPATNGHTIVIPKQHFTNWEECENQYLVGTTLLAKKISKRITNSKKIDAWGINYLSNQGSVAGQVINHFHLHVIPKFAKNSGLICEMKKDCLEDLKTVQEWLINSKTN